MMKKFDDPCFYCDEGKDCGKYNLFFFKPSKCAKKFKKIMWAALFVVKVIVPLLIFGIIISAIGVFLGSCANEKNQEKHDYLEINHILIEGDEAFIDLNAVKNIEKSGFEIDKIIVVDCQNFIFETKRKNVKYMWILSGSRMTVFPLLERCDEY